MLQYKLEIKQVVDYPRCRVYRQFIQTLIEDRNIRTGGGSGLFYYTVLCCRASSEVTYCQIDGINYTVYPEEGICSVKELSGWFRIRSGRQAVNILEDLQQRHLISFLILNRGKIVKFKIRDFGKYNILNDHKCLCQSETEFFFLPVSKAAELVSANICSEMNIVLDLWISAIHNDERVSGSGKGPVVYFRNGTGAPLITYAKLAARWGLSESTVSKIMKKLQKLKYISLRLLPGEDGITIYLRNYLSAMYRISDIMIDKEEIAMKLSVRLELPVGNVMREAALALKYQIDVSTYLLGLPRIYKGTIIQKLVEILSTQGISCFGCPKAKYRMFHLSDNGVSVLILGETGIVVGERIGLQIGCGEGSSKYIFELTLSPCRDNLIGEISR